jgi:CubicO group peptidase (beta-lactamase class C family)
MLFLALLSLGCRPASDVGDSDPSEETDLPDDTDPELPTLDEDAIAAILEAADDDFRRNEATAVQIAIWRDGAILWRGELGTKHPEGTEPPGPDTLFQVGSDTKKMTAVAVLQQVRAGRLDLHAPLTEALPGFALASDPGWAADATLHDLLSHQGGLYDWVAWDDVPEDAALRDVAYGELAEREWVLTPPGVMYNYSNPNFSLAGLAAEQAAGKPFADVLEDDLFAPLGMERSLTRKADVEADGDYAVGHGMAGSANDSWDVFAGSDYHLATVPMEDVVDSAFLRPAGGVWSTASDMARFGGFLMEGHADVLDAADLAAVHEQQTPIYPRYEGLFYGYGLFVAPNGATLDGEFYPTPVWRHGGNTPSFTSTTYVLPDHGVSLSILSNGYGDVWPATIVACLEAAADLPDPIPSPALPSEETDHALLVGTYEDPQLGAIEITDADGRLRIAIPSLADRGFSVGPTLTFSITDVYTFTLAGGTYDLAFVADETGAYRYARNRLFVGSR